MRQQGLEGVHDGLAVSIHALLAECDRRMYIYINVRNVSIHALLAECDRSVCFSEEARKAFQSTHSLRSATGSSVTRGGLYQFQSTHSLRSATRFSCRIILRIIVSIHALLAECDVLVVPNGPPCSSFNPRTPCGVRRRFRYRRNRRHAVSIHALLAECD